MKFFRGVTILCAILASFSGAHAATPELSSGRQQLGIIETVEPMYPGALLQAGVNRGHARIAINVKASSELSDWFILEYSHREFADAAVDAIRNWRFQPARLNGEPIAVTTEVFFRFEGGRVLVSQNANESVGAFVSSMEPGRYYKIAALKDLDRIPEPRRTKEPLYTESLLRRGIRGDVVVEFIIDEEGNVRLPTVVSTDHLELASLANEAVREWEFAPPVRRGKRTAVRVQQRFGFGHDRP